MNKFRVRLTVIFILLIGLSMLAAGIFMARMLQKSQMETLKQSMIREIHIVHTTVAWKNDGSLLEKRAYYTHLAEELKKSADARITFIQVDGTVLGDSDHDPSTMENHSNREEIVQAKADGFGYAIRYSQTLNKNMLYVAVPVTNAGQIAGYERLSMSLEDVESSILHLWTVFISGLVLLFLISGVIGYRIAQGLTKPLEEITGVAEQISRLNYQSRVQIKNKDEIGKLGQAINTMAHNLALQLNRISEDENRLKNVLENMINGVVMIDSEEKLVLMNRSAEQISGFSAKELLGKHYSELKHQLKLIPLIEKCIIDKERIRDEMTFYFPEERIVEVNLVPIIQANEEWGGILMILHDITSIRRLERMRSEFIANVSHELKTPVASVKGFAETLLAGALNEPETAKSFLQIIYDESDRLNRLIGDILELSKIETKLVPLHFSPVEMHSFVSKTLETMSNEAVKKQIELSMEVSPELFMEADEDRLRQILINLLSNGINYTPAGGKVMVKAEPVPSGDEYDGEKVRIAISDTGIGIPKEDLPRIFERFYRVDKARSRSSGGTGLGLSIVKHLVDLHKGSIKVESMIGRGSTFIIELPLIQE